MSSRSPAEVSFYLGLATAIATFSAASVVLGVLQCRRQRERAVAVGVVLFATLGITASLATVARGRTSGLGNILIGTGIIATAVFVLARAMQMIFTTTTAPKTDYVSKSTRNSATQRLSVTWTSQQPSTDTRPWPSSQPATAVLRAPLHVTSAAFLAVLVLATAFATPDIRDLLKDFLHSRPVGPSSAGAQSQQDDRPRQQDYRPRVSAHDDLTGIWELSFASLDFDNVARSPTFLVTFRRATDKRCPFFIHTCYRGILHNTVADRNEGYLLVVVDNAGNLTGVTRAADGIQHYAGYYTLHGGSSTRVRQSNPGSHAREFQGEWTQARKGADGTRHGDFTLLQ